MKRFVCLFFVFLVCAGLWGCGETPGTEYETVRVQTRYEAENYIRDQFSEYTSHWRYEYSYDEYGNLTQQKWYLNDELQRTDRYTYDDRGNRIKAVTMNHDGWIPWPSTREEYSYDENGNQILEVVYDPWAESQRVLREYDGAGNMVRLEIINADGSANTVQTYTYNEQGNRLAVHDESIAGVERVMEYTYDENGNLLSWHYYEDGILGEYVEHVYDHQGRKTYSARHDADGTVTVTATWEYSYNDAENITTTVYADGRTQYDYYNEYGELYCSETYDAEGTLSLRVHNTYEPIQVLKADKD